MEGHNQITSVLSEMFTSMINWIRIRLYMPKVAKISSLASFPIIGVLRWHVNLT